MSTFTISQTPSSLNLFLYPNGDDTSQLTPVGETNNYECVDDTKGNYNEDTDYVHTSETLDTTDIYNLPNHTTESGTINYVTVFARVKSQTHPQAQSGTYKLLVEMGNTEYYSGNLNVNTSYRTVSCSWDLNPDDDGAWEWADIDNLMIGLVCNSPTRSGFLINKYFRPNAAGTINNGARWLGCYGYGSYQGAGNSSNYTYCDDEEPDDCDTVIVLSTSLHRDSYNIPNHTTETGTIQKVTVFVRARGYYGNVKVKASIRIGGSYYDSPLSAYCPKLSFATISYEWALNPDDSAAWEWGDIDNLEIGSGYPSSTANITQVYAIVQYIEDVNPDIRTTQCFAMVNYSPPAETITLTKPKSIRDSHGKNIPHFSFPDGDYRIADFGASGKTVVLSGTQIISADSRLESIKQMAMRGDKVTVAGLDDSDLNDDYIIRSVKKTEEGGASTRVYDWEIELERTD